MISTAPVWHLLPNRWPERTETLQVTGPTVTVKVGVALEESVPATALAKSVRRLLDSNVAPADPKPHPPRKELLLAQLVALVILPANPRARARIGLENDPSNFLTDHHDLEIKRFCTRIFEKRRASVED